MNDEFLRITLSLTDSEVEQASHRKNSAGFRAFLEAQLPAAMRNFVLRQLSGYYWEYQQSVCPHPNAALKVIFVQTGVSGEDEKLLCTACGAEFDDDPHPPAEMDDGLEAMYEDRYAELEALNEFFFDPDLDGE